MTKDEYPVNAGLSERTPKAARLARRRRFAAGGAVLALTALTAAVAVLFIIPGPLNVPLGGKAPMHTSAMVGAPNQTDGGGNQLPPPDTTELPCSAVPLRGGDYSKWNEMGVGGDGSYSESVNNAGMDDALGRYGLKPADYDSQAKNNMKRIRGAGSQMRLVLEVNPSSTPTLDAVRLTVENGTAVFEYTDCAGESPRLYGGCDDALACNGMLVLIPPEAEGLPFVSRKVDWDGLSDAEKARIMLERIMRNPDMAKYYFFDQTLPGLREAPKKFLTQSPMETAGIFGLGQGGRDWIMDRWSALSRSSQQETMEEFVLSELVYNMPQTPPVSTPIPTPTPAVTDGAQDDAAQVGSAVDSAFQHDLDTHLLSQGGRALKAGERQYSAFFFLVEPSEISDFTAAVLASPCKPGGKPSEPQLFIVQAVYADRGTAANSDWKLRDWTITQAKTPSMAEYPCLLYRSWDRELYALYGELNRKLAEAGSEQFELRLNNAGGATATLLGTTGTLRWFRLSEWVQREKEAGSQNYGLQTLDFATVGAAAWKLAPLSGGKWEKTGEGSLGRLSRAERVGLQSVGVEAVVAADGGIWSYSYELNPSTKAVTLWRCFCNAYGRGGEPEFYVCKDKAVYNSMMAALNVDADVSGLIIADDTPSFKLPLDREELGYLVSLVQDMPGGVAAIHPSIEYNGGWPSKSLPAVSKKNTVISWAKKIGEVLGYLDKPGTSPMEKIDSLPQDMAAAGPAGAPALLKWDFDVAAQEGKAALTLYANPQSGQVWSAVQYRLFGSTAVNTRYMKTRDGDKTLYLLLTELTFGRVIEDPEGLPR